MLEREDYWWIDEAMFNEAFANNRSPLRRKNRLKRDWDHDSYKQLRSQKAPLKTIGLSWRLALNSVR